MLSTLRLNGKDMLVKWISYTLETERGVSHSYVRATILSLQDFDPVLKESAVGRRTIWLKNAHLFIRKCRDKSGSGAEARLTVLPLRRKS